MQNIKICSDHTPVLNGQKNSAHALQNQRKQHCKDFQKGLKSEVMSRIE